MRVVVPAADVRGQLLSMHCGQVGDLHQTIYHARKVYQYGPLACRHRVPKELKEFKLICDPAKKPATLLALLQTLQGQKTIIFLASLQAAHR